MPEVMEIVDRATGHISTYPAHSDEFHSMKTQIDWQRRFHPDYRFFYRLRFQVDADNATATSTNCCGAFQAAEQTPCQEI